MSSVKVVPVNSAYAIIVVKHDSKSLTFVSIFLAIILRTSFGILSIILGDI